MSENVFWNADIYFIRGAVDNKTAFDNYIAAEQERLANTK